jgi:hypothetical protein
VINGIVNCELLKSSEDDAIVWAYARLHREPGLGGGQSAG